jgi:bifunctional non-homologous end joining protein LigD
VRIAGRDVAISNPDRVLFPDCGITKGDLVAYYRDVAPRFVPHARGRPLTLQRFPQGIARPGFFQQRRAAHYPDWVAGVRVARAEASAGRVDHVVCNDAPTLVYLANQGAMTFHAWLSRDQDIEHPDRLVFDLDPAHDDARALVRGARYVRALLERLELPSFVMSTGSTGLHVVVPIAPAWPFDDVRRFARRVADRLTAAHPETFTTEARIRNRQGRLYLDVGRNAWGQTAVLPYSVRAKPSAPVATPLDWSELGRADFSPRRFHLRNIRRRLGQKRDPWSAIDRGPVSLDGAHAALDRLARRP